MSDEWHTEEPRQDVEHDERDVGDGPQHVGVECEEAVAEQPVPHPDGDDLRDMRSS